jgi:tricorn protease-like protein
MGWKDASHILFRSRRTEWNDFKTKTTTNLTNNLALDVIPMWKGNRIYFASDRDQPNRMNLYSYDLSTKQTRKLTSFTEYDVKFPSLGDNAIVFENGGSIYRFDLATEKAERVPVTIAEDVDSGRPAVVDVSRSVTNYEIAPDGSRALFGARGDVFTVPAKYGPTRNLTQTPGVHERDSKWSPDGKGISYISDASGEDEIWVKPQDGAGAAIQLAKDTKSPLAPRSDEVKIKEEPKAGDAKPAEPKKDAGTAVKVDVDGLMARIAVLPTPAANYRSLTSVGSRLYYGRASTREPGALYVFNLERQTETQVLTGGGYEISADGKKILVSATNRYAIIDVPSGRVELRDFLDLSDMKVTVDRHAEWRQMFNERKVSSSSRWTGARPPISPISGRRLSARPASR